jgi:hypothetical protein
MVLVVAAGGALKILYTQEENMHPPQRVSSRRTAVTSFLASAICVFAFTVPRLAHSNNVRTVPWQGCVPSGTNYICPLQGGYDPNGSSISSQLGTGYFDFVVNTSRGALTVNMYKQSYTGAVYRDWANLYPFPGPFPQTVDYPLTANNVKSNPSPYDYIWATYGNPTNITLIGFAAVSFF